MTQLASNMPNTSIKFLDANGNITTPWLMFLTQLYQRTGGNLTPPLSLTQVQEYVGGLVIEDANGFNATIDGSSGVPIVTLETTVNGLIYGNGTAMGAVTIGANLTFSNGTLSASGGGGSGAPALAFAARHG
jgi:hypothetical protein